VSMCDYGDCVTDTKDATHEVVVTITATLIDERQRKRFCCLRHASLWLANQADRMREPAQ
jgi:hypothetical protein